MRRLAPLLFVLLASTTAGAEETRQTGAPPQAPGAAPTMRPPPGMEGKRRLSDDDYARKKENYYFTGLPLFAVDPNFGVGAGARVYYYYDGYKDDARFAYTPYLHRVYVQGFASNQGVQDHVIDYDAPAFPDANYRVRATLEYEAALDWPYFGIGSRSMRPLSYPGAPGVVFRNIDDYDASQAGVHFEGTYSRYNFFGFKRPILQLALERNLLGGILRSMVGVNVTYVKLQDYSGDIVNATGASGQDVRAPEATTLLATDCAAHRIVGCGGGWDNVLRLALSIDTRDFEPDPNSGVYVELSSEFGPPGALSDYHYMRVMLSVRGFYSPIPRLTDLVLAARGVYEVQTKSTPFFSQTLMPFIDDNHAGLGGFRTLRGFRQNRFVGPILALTNYEARWTFAKFHVAGQGFGLIAAPFVDIGRVFDDVEQTTLGGWKRAQGLGFRVAWNEATVITADYGFSEEGDALYLNFNHIF